MFNTGLSPRSWKNGRSSIVRGECSLVLEIMTRKNTPCRCQSRLGVTFTHHAFTRYQLSLSYRSYGKYFAC